LLDRAIAISDGALSICLSHLSTTPTWFKTSKHILH